SDRLPACRMCGSKQRQAGSLSLRARNGQRPLAAPKAGRRAAFNPTVVRGSGTKLKVDRFLAALEVEFEIARLLLVIPAGRLDAHVRIRVLEYLVARRSLDFR